MKRLVSFVEGPGDVKAVPILLRRLLAYHGLRETISIDPDPFRVGGIGVLCAKGGEKWKKWLGAARKREMFGGVLLLLDGDAKPKGGGEFCPATAARALVSDARDAGAGTKFSLAVVFACREYESWLLAGVESLAGKLMADGRVGVRADAPRFEGNPEESPRHAKGALGEWMRSGYKETLDQAELTRLVDLEVVRQRQLRSFVRLESALLQLGSAFETGQNVATPSTPPE